MLFGTTGSMSFCFCFCTLLSLPLKCCNGIILETMCGTYWTFLGVPQAIIHHAFDALDDIMGCCLRCMVPGASDSASWWDIHWICWKVGLIQQVFSVSNFSLFPIHIHSAVFAVAGCSLPLPHRDSKKESFLLGYWVKREPWPLCSFLYFVIFANFRSMTLLGSFSIWQGARFNC